MTVLSCLWIPILVSSAFVFVASSIIHMALQFWHRSDCGKVPQEDKVMEALQPFSIPPGDYMVPNISDHSEMRTDAFKEKIKKGPVMIVTVLPNEMFGVAKSLVLWFVYLLVVSYLSAYVACHALPPGATHRHVFRIIGVTSFLGYAAALWQMSIWYRRSWVTTIKTSIDGVLYAAITAATFAWLWHG